MWQVLLILCVILTVHKSAWAGEDRPVSQQMKAHQEKSDCWVNVKIGEHVFRVPNRRNTYISKRDGSGGDLAHGICHPSNSAAIDADSLSFFPQYLPGYEPEVVQPIATETRMGFAVQIIIDTYPENYFPWLEFAGVKRKLKRDGIELADLPKQNGFYVYKGIQYIAMNENFITASGEPVVIGGVRHRYSTIFPWKGELRIAIWGINDLYIPKEEWKDFYYLVLDYMEALEITAGENN